MFQEKLKTMLMQNFGLGGVGGGTECIMGNVEMANIEIWLFVSVLAIFHFLPFLFLHPAVLTTSPLPQFPLGIALSFLSI